MGRKQYEEANKHLVEAKGTHRGNQPLVAVRRCPVFTCCSCCCIRSQLVEGRLVSVGRQGGNRGPQWKSLYCSFYLPLASPPLPLPKVVKHPIIISIYDHGVFYKLHLKALTQDLAYALDLLLIEYL